MEVVVQGDQVGSFAEFIKVPETFTRNHNEVCSRADLLTSIAYVFWVILGVLMLVVLVQKHRIGALRWKTGLIVGGAVLVAAVAGNLNSLPLLFFSYDTTQAYDAFLLMTVSFGLIGAAFGGGIICLVGTSGNALGREVLHDGRQDPFGHLSPKRMLSGGFMRSIFVGYGLAFSQLGFLVLFYILGSRYFEVWSPATVTEYSDAFSTAIPWIYALLVGLVAASLEEFFFRLLAISLLIKWLGKRWLAVLLPAIVWGFVHSNYPVEPIYTRGIELTIVGVILGVVFLRFGIWSTFISHYVYNAFVVSFPMLKSSSLYFQISGCVVVGALLLLAIPALFAYVTGRYRTEPAMEEEIAEPATRPVVSITPPPAPAQQNLNAYLLNRVGWKIAGGLTLVSIALLFGMKAAPFGERTLELTVSRQEAVEIAREFCQQIDLDVDDYSMTTWFESHTAQEDYAHLLRKAGVARADTLAGQETDPWIWFIRWFKAEEKEEIVVGVNSAGSVAFFDHQIPESRPGPELETQIARSTAERAVHQYFGLVLGDGGQFKLLEERSEKREARMDHHFVWERIDRKVEDGEFRTTTSVQGDRFSYYGRHYEAPEEFLRTLNQTEMKDAITLLVMSVVLPASLILFGVYFFRAYREKAVTWRLPLWIGSITAAFVLVGRLNQLPSFFSSYDTSESVATYVGMQSVQLLLGAVLMGLTFAVSAALGLALFRKLYPNEAQPGQWVSVLLQKAGNRRLWLHSLAMAASLDLVLRAVVRLSQYIDNNWLSEYLRPTLLAPGPVASYLPFLDGVILASNGVMGLLGGLAAILVWRQATQRTWILIMGATILTILFGAVGPAEDLQHFGALAAINAIALGAVLLLVTRVIRFNLLAYVIFAWCTRLIPSGWSLIETSDLFYQINGALMLVLALVPLALAALATKR